MKLIDALLFSVGLIIIVLLVLCQLETESAITTTNGSFGLQSMETRIITQGGELSIDAPPGKGTTISGWLPVQKVSSRLVLSN